MLFCFCGICLGSRAAEPQGKLTLGCNKTHCIPVKLRTTPPLVAWSENYSTLSCHGHRISVQSPQFCTGMCGGWWHERWG